MAEWFAKRTLGSLPDEAARRWGAREALYFHGRRWTFAELAAHIDAVAKGLIQLGVTPGEKVALWMVNRPEFIQTAFAIMKIGAVLVPVNTRLRTEDVGYILAQSDSSTLVIAERSGAVDYLGMARALLPSLDAAGGLAEPKSPELRRAVVLGAAPPPGTVAWHAMLARGAAVTDTALLKRAAAVDPDATAFLMYTSGTTGFPKGVMHSHVIIRNVAERGFRLAITPADTVMMYLPLFHLFGFSEGMLMSMTTGARQVLTETFDADEILDLMVQERTTILHGFDTHFQDLMEAQDRAPRDLPRLRTGICVSGMSSSIPIARRARTFGRLVSGYGMSEFGVGVTIGALDSTEEQSAEASGYPVPGYDVKVVNPATGREQPRGAPGEILVRGYMVMQGYYKKPEETAKTVDAEGWVHTGDMGVFREDGHLRFMGRYKDMLKIGGENVDPMEVEAFLMGHPAVSLAAVVGLPDPRLAEVAVAFIRLDPGHALTEPEVLDYCRGKIASFKIPRHVVFVDDLPLTGSGKIQKVKLREEAQRRLRGPDVLPAHARGS